MGNTAVVAIRGCSSRSHAYAERRLRELEQRWSRFIPTSDISRLNMSRGQPTKVHADTVTLVQYLVTAHEQSYGAFDPTLLPALVSLGYASSLRDSSMTTVLPELASKAEPLSNTMVNEDTFVVQLPVGITLDPGGLGKGLAADIVATELIAEGASGACVSVGGDLRCTQSDFAQQTWTIKIESPFDPTRIIAELAIANGGVATSSTKAKRWHTQRREFHHLLSPTTHLPLPEDGESPVQATVIGAEAVWAEVFATTVLVAGVVEGLALAQKLHLGALVVLNNGEIIVNDQWKEFLR